MLIYKITNKINGKIYIGQTIQDLKKRWQQHCSSSKINKTNSPLHSSIKKYGKDSFIIEEIDGANCLSELNYLEQHYIHIYNSLSPNGYNLKIGGESFTFSDETRKRMSESAKIKKFSKTHKQNISNSLKGNTRALGRKLSDEHKNKIRKANKNKKHSEETKLKIALSKLGKKRIGFVPWNKKNV